MKKIFLSVLLIFATIFLVAPANQVNASTWNTKYIFDSHLITTNGVTLTVDADTNIFTLNGTSTGQTTTFNLSHTLYQLNSNGSQLDNTKTYLLWYEYISGSINTESSNVTVFDTGVKEEYIRSLLVKQSTYTQNKGYVIYPDGASLARVKFATSASATNFKYKLHLIEIPNILTDQFSLVNDLNYAANGNIGITFEDSNTLSINGSTASTSIIDLSSRIHDDLKDPNKIYLFAFDYISGSVESDGLLVAPFSINGLLSVSMGTSQLTLNPAYALQNITSLNVGLVNSETATNFKYKIYVQEILLYDEEQEPAPGETTTPPAGVFLLGSSYDGQIYYNRNEELDTVTHKAYNISTSLGNTFNLSLLETEPIQFSLSSNKQRLVASYLDPQAQPDSVSVDGPGDISISIVDSNIEIWYGDDIETFDEFSFLSSGFLEFYLLIENEPEGTFDLFDDYTNTLNGLTLTISDGNLIELNGTASASATFSNLISSINTLENGKNYKFTYEYVSGSTNATAFDAILFNGATYQLNIPQASYQTSEASLQVPWSASITGAGMGALTGTYNHLIYRINVEEVILQHTVTFNSTGGSAVAAQEVENGSLALIPDNPTREGYVFQYWRDSLEVTPPFEFTTPITSDITLYAVWEEFIPETYTITFDSNGGTIVNDLEVTEGDYAAAPTPPTKVENVFVGWYEDIELLVLFSFTTPITSDMTLYAKWVAADVTVFTITFNSNGGTAVAAQTVEEGNLPITPTAPTRSGYTFAGWYTNIQLTNAFSFTGDGLASNLTLYAKWTAVSGETPIIPDAESSEIPWLYIGIGAAVLLVLASDKKKKRG